MGRTKKVGTTGRFGPRAGSTVRKRRARIEKEMKMNHPCPKCLAPAVKRVSVGVWSCQRCGLEFAGGAYKPTTKFGESFKVGRGATSTKTSRPAGQSSKHQ